MNMPDEDSDEVRHWAELWAQLRLQQIAHEQQRILRTFPQLAEGAIPLTTTTPLALPSGREAILERARAQVAQTARENRTNRANQANRTISRREPGTRRTFSQEQKEAVIQRMVNGEYCGDLARELDARESVIRGWGTRAGIKLPVMPRAERVRRTQATRLAKALEGARAYKSLPSEMSRPEQPERFQQHAATIARTTSTPRAPNAKRPKGMTQKLISDKKGREILQSITDRGGTAHYKDIAKDIGLHEIATQYRLKKRMEYEHITRDGDGNYSMTKKGTKFLAAAPVET